jgi:hypothetical protein
MAIEAPLSKHKRTNLKIYIVICIGLAIWCAYDGFLNEKWIKEHTDAEGNPEAYLVFNRSAPPFFVGVAVLLGIYLFAIRNRRIIADEEELILSARERISYDSIQRIDKTHFKSRGFFIVTYEDRNGRLLNRKLSDRSYDNLAAVLDRLVAKIT